MTIGLICFLTIIEMFPNLQEANYLITWILKMYGVGSTYSVGGTQGRVVRVVTHTSSTWFLDLCSPAIRNTELGIGGFSLFYVWFYLFFNINLFILIGA